MNLSFKKKIICIVLLIAVFVSACGNAVSSDSGEAGQKVSQTAAADISQTVVMTVGDANITGAEAVIYLYIMQKQYESYYGSDIWSESYDATMTTSTWDTETADATWGDWLLYQVASQIEELELLSQWAIEDGLELTEEELLSLEETKEAAYESMEADLAAYGVTKELVMSVYEKSALAGLCYENMMDYDLTLTDEEYEELRAITVMQIFIAYEEDNAKELINAVLERADDGEDFETLAKQYSSDNSQLTLTFDEEGYVFETAGIIEESFAQAAWALDSGEISAVIESSYGYHVIKCIEKNDGDAILQAAAHAQDIKRQAKFLEDYTERSADIVCVINEEWYELSVI